MYTSSGAGIPGAERRHNIRDGAHVHVHARARPAARVPARGRRDAARAVRQLAPRRPPAARQQPPIANGLQTGRQSAVNAHAPKSHAPMCTFTAIGWRSCSGHLVSDLKTFL